MGVGWHGAFPEQEEQPNNTLEAFPCPKEPLQTGTYKLQLLDSRMGSEVYDQQCHTSDKAETCPAAPAEHICFPFFVYFMLGPHHMASSLCSCAGRLPARQCDTLPCGSARGLGSHPKDPAGCCRREICGAAAVIPAGFGILKAQSTAVPCYPPEHLEKALSWVTDMGDEICDIHAAVRSNSGQNSPLA